MKVLCIFTNLLGNKATAQRMIETLDRMEGVNPTYVLVGVEDYSRFPPPNWAKLTDAWEGRYLARRKAEPLLQQEFDALLVNSWEFVIEFQNLARRIPAAALMDAVPSTVHSQLVRRGHGGWKRSAANLVHHRAFRRAVGTFRMFLPMGSDCADALEREYGVNRNQCVITLAPQNLKLWTSKERAHQPPLQLLFVANDFVRKGGEFLLKLYRALPAGSARLTIASNDAALERYSLPEGAQWLRGRNREQLLEIYHSTDLFLFPTQQDYMPQVLAEALATGVPCIANNVGGIRDLVKDGETGFLMSPEDPVERWAEQIGSLDTARLAALSRSARRFAERELPIERFEYKLAQVMDLLKPKGYS